MYPEISWELVPTFLLLSEHLHFGHTAERLGISHQAVSKRIARLEAHLGVPLVMRSTRRVELTEAGRSFRDELAAPASAIGGAIERVRRSTAPGRLSIAVSTDLPPAWAQRVSGWTARRGAPSLLESRAPEDALALLREGRLDLLVILGEPPDRPSTIVGHEPAVVLVPARHPAAGRGRVHPGELADLAVAVGDVGAESDRRAAVARLQGDPDHPSVVAPRVGTIAQGLALAVRDQHAAALIPLRSLDGLDLDGVATVSPDPPFDFPVLLVAQPNLPREPFTALAEHLRAASG